jgi:hypothetical protein
MACENFIMDPSLAATAARFEARFLLGFRSIRARSLTE